MIRVAARADFAALWPLLIEMHAEQGLFPLNKNKAARTLAEAIDGGRVLMAEEGDAVMRTFAWTVMTAYYADQPFLADLWLYVRPAYRRSTTAVKLRNALKAEAAARGLPLMVGAVGKTRDGARLFGAAFEKVGELFLMRA